MRLYINGIEDAHSGVTDTTNNIYIYHNPIYFGISYGLINGGAINSDYYAGKMREYNIFDSVLSSTAISNFYTATGYTIGSTTISKDITLLTGTGTIGSTELTLPASPTDGRIVRIATDQTITSLTLSANAGQTFDMTPPTTLAQSESLAYLYDLASTKWYRVG